jgi:Xaa-Pro aminopeptidase
MKTPERLAEDYAIEKASVIQEAFLAGFKAGREMSEKEMFDFYLELRKKHGQQEPSTKPPVEKFSLTLIEKTGFF